MKNQSCSFPRLVSYLQSVSFWFWGCKNRGIYFASSKLQPNQGLLKSDRRYPAECYGDESV